MTTAPGTQLNVNAHDNVSSKKALTMTLIAAFLGWMFDGMEMGIFTLIARPAFTEMWQLDPSGIVDVEAYVQRWMGIITAAFLFGAAAGGLVFGWLGDKIGRVKAMTISILFYSLFTGACYFATTPWQMAALRFIAALGMGGEWSLGVALVMEVWPSRYRPLMAGFIGAAANVGFLIVGAIGSTWAVTSDSWRWLLIIGAAPALLTFIIRIFVPESERWKEAVEGKDVRPLKEIFTSPLLPRTMLAIIFATIPLLATWGMVQWIPLWTAQLVGDSDPKAKAYSQSVLAIAAILGSLAAPLLGQKVGRRPAYFAMCVMSILCAYLLFEHSTGYNAMFLVGVFFVSFFATSFFGWLPLYLPELFPTRVRATAQGVAFNFGRIIAGIGVFNMGHIMNWFGNSYAKAGLAISLVYLLGMVLIWLAPETKGRPLPE